MKYLIHGDDVAASRKYLSGLIEEFKVTSLDGKGLTIPILEENLVSTSLFSEKKVVVVENLLSKNAKKKDFVKFLNGFKSEMLLVLWEDKKLLKTSFNSLKEVEIKEFLLPTYYFQFLDSFVPAQKKRIFTLYHELLKSYAPEQLLFSLIKRMRLLVILANNGSSTEVQKMPDWMQSKLKQQGRMWKQESLLSFYKKLQEAEVKLKTGKLPVDLSKHLDILILSEIT